MSIIDNILESVLEKYNIQKEDIEKVKKILGKIEFTKRDGRDVMVIDIGDGIELTIVQKDKK